MKHRHGWKTIDFREVAKETGQTLEQVADTKKEMEKFFDMEKVKGEKYVYYMRENKKMRKEKRKYMVKALSGEQAKMPWHE